MPNIAQRLDSHTTRLDILKQKLLNLERTGAQSTVSDFSDPPGVATATGGDEYVWLSGGWASRDDVDHFKTQPTSACPWLLDFCLDLTRSNSGSRCL
eukprot:1491849-Amphidinium_carterae.1